VLVAATPGKVVVVAAVGAAVAGADVVAPNVGAAAAVLVDDVESTVDVGLAVDSGAVAGGPTRGAVLGGAVLGRDALHAARANTAAPATRRWPQSRRRVLNMAHHDGGHRPEIPVAPVCVSESTDCESSC
jgi:hypothetical protein